MRVSKKFLGAKKGTISNKQRFSNTAKSSAHGLHQSVGHLSKELYQKYQPRSIHVDETPSSCNHNSAPQEDPLGSCISYIACIHLHTSIVKYLPCMVKNFDCTNTLLLTFKISVVKYRKVVRV